MGLGQLAALRVRGDPVDRPAAAPDAAPRAGVGAGGDGAADGLGVGHHGGLGRRGLGLGGGPGLARARLGLGVGLGLAPLDLVAAGLPRRAGEARERALASVGQAVAVSREHVAVRVLVQPLPHDLAHVRLGELLLLPDEVAIAVLDCHGAVHLDGALPELSLPDEVAVVVVVGRDGVDDLRLVVLAEPLACGVAGLVPLGDGPLERAREAAVVPRQRREAVHRVVTRVAEVRDDGGPLADLDRLPRLR